jgi:hypothetical protein
VNDFRLAGGVFGGIGLIMLCVAGGLAQHQIRIIRTWPSVDGTITRSAVEHYRGRSSMYYPDLEARYAVDGREYVSELPVDFASSSKSDMRAKAEAHPVGSVCRLQYDPSDPEEVRCADGFTLGGFFLPVIFGFLGLVMAGICLPLLVVPWLRRRRENAGYDASGAAAAPLAHGSNWPKSMRKTSSARWK